MIERAGKIKLLALDVDGVLTDGRIIYGNYGDELKNFDVNDGFGIFMVKRSGIKCVILTAKASPVVTKRAKELRIDRVYQDFHYKIKALEKIRKRFRVSDEEICFVGDEIIDIPVLKRVGLAVSPPNAAEEVKSCVHLITGKPGGCGAVREVCDFILRSQGTWSEVTSVYFE
ncbi:MAG: phenylphosphate carboxylase subunit delta [Candidatus Makaraimicrobium thalassicum]|nr:MAG: phenylphosphate carboxylase subunit delta [Candidatus Omnitrophota bacterium]